MVSLTAALGFQSCTNAYSAYGDTNLFCTCAPVAGEDQEDFTGMEAPSPT
jgi:glycine dehydrogenase